MADSSPPKGLIIDLITPLKQGGNIDGRGLGRLLDRVLPFVQAVYLASPVAGEGRNLGAVQREELLEKTLVVTRGRVPIFIWVSQDSEEETQKTLSVLKKRLDKRKYKGPVFWVDTPLYYHSNRGLPSYYQSLSDGEKALYLLHNDPALIRGRSRPLKRNNIRTSILKDLAQISSIHGLIFSGSLERVRNYQKAVRARTDFRIYDGDESRFLSYPSLSGIVSVGSNLVPEAWQKITTSSLNQSGDREQYPDFLQQIWQTGRYLQALIEIYHPASVPLIKHILADTGTIESPFCSFKAGDVTAKVQALKGLMAQQGDFRAPSQ
jgi:dihydrodipicolinate synthase/N-acetylneuraminate lyase